jgi:hypothetical protein
MLITYLESFRSERWARLEGPPSGGPSVHAVHLHVLGRQADGADVRGEVHRTVQTNHGHVVTIGLKLKF